MGLDIKIWEIVEDGLKPVDTGGLVDSARLEKELEIWLKKHPEILGEDILLIGEQVPTSAGLIDLLGLDRELNTVIVELKREKLTSREALAQALDYAASIEEWGWDELDEVCVRFCEKKLEEVLDEHWGGEYLPEAPNSSQRILLVGFGIDDSLKRTIEWLAESGVDVNAVLLKHAVVGSTEILARTVVVPESFTVRKKTGWEKSDEPGNYPPDELREKLLNYLKRPGPAAQWIREVLLPLCLQALEENRNYITREEIVKELVQRGEADDESQAGIKFTSVSNQLDLAKNDFLRQVIRYERDPEHQWLKRRFWIDKNSASLVKEVLEELGVNPSGG